MRNKRIYMERKIISLFQLVSNPTISITSCSRSTNLTNDSLKVDSEKLRHSVSAACPIVHTLS